MSKNKFTPGPWKTRRDNMSLKIDFDHIANNDDCIEELSKNSALIAAAPEMFEALEQVLNLTKSPDLVNEKEVIELVKSALRKARGEA